MLGYMDNNKLKLLLDAAEEINRENCENLKTKCSRHTNFAINMKNQSRYSYDYVKIDTLTNACVLVTKVKEKI
jgi:hypothetical protein